VAKCCFEFTYLPLTQIPPSCLFRVSSKFWLGSRCVSCQNAYPVADGDGRRISLLRQQHAMYILFLSPRLLPPWKCDLFLPPATSSFVVRALHIVRSVYQFFPRSLVKRLCGSFLFLFPFLVRPTYTWSAVFFGFLCASHFHPSGHTFPHPRTRSGLPYCTQSPVVSFFLPLFDTHAYNNNTCSSSGLCIQQESGEFPFPLVSQKSPFCIRLCYGFSFRALKQAEKGGSFSRCVVREFPANFFQRTSSFCPVLEVSISPIVFFPLRLIRCFVIDEELSNIPRTRFSHVPVLLD